MTFACHCGCMWLSVIQLPPNMLHNIIFGQCNLIWHDAENLPNCFYIHIGDQDAPVQYHSKIKLLYAPSKSKLRTSSGPYTTGAGQRSLQVHSVFFGKRLADAIVKLVILLCSVERQLIRINNIHNVDLVIVLGFASLEVIAITGNQIHTILVALLQHGNQRLLKPLAQFVHCAAPPGLSYTCIQHLMQGAGARHNLCKYCSATHHAAHLLCVCHAKWLCDRAENASQNLAQGNAAGSCMCRLSCQPALRTSNRGESMPLGMPMTFL